MTLRQALEGTNCRVIELIPPAVQTGLAGGHTGHGAPLEVFADAVFGQIVTGQAIEIGYGPTEHLSVEISGKPLEQLFRASVLRFETKGYQDR